MLGYLEQAKDHDVAVSAMWIQDWSGKITTDFGTRGRRQADFILKHISKQILKIVA